MHDGVVQSWVAEQEGSVRANFALWLLVLALGSARPERALAFKIGYQGIPVVVDDFPPVHEAVTAAGIAHFCRSVGVEKLQASPARLFQAVPHGWACWSRCVQRASWIVDAEDEPEPVVEERRLEANSLDADQGFRVYACPSKSKVPSLETVPW